MADRFKSFYNSRNYQFAWFEPAGLTEQALAFWNLHENYIHYSKDSSIYNHRLHNQMNLLISENSFKVDPSDSKIIRTELEMTQHFFDFANNAYQGKVDPLDLQWYIPRKKVDVVKLLDSLINNKGTNLQEWEPVNKQYSKTREKLVQLYNVEKNGGWGKVNLGNKKVYKVGDSSVVVRQIKKRLLAYGDLPTTDTSMLYNSIMENAVKKVQQQFGIKDDGVVGSATVERLNVPVEERIEQVMVNMERMRWMPEEPEGNYIRVNIPEFTMYVYENNNIEFTINVVVGKEANKTQVFSDVLEYVVFSPYWNIPRSIIKNEILPAIRKNSNYLQRNNMEQTGYSNGLPVIRQKPGGNNSLGRVKFIFPNNFNIYFHDTPAKSLFSNTNRAFSHGCIRVEEPVKLAKYLLRDPSQWTDEAVYTAMHSEKEKWVKINDPLPVRITYFTAWVDGNGVLNFRDDIYGHDTTMKKRLFQHSSSH